MAKKTTLKKELSKVEKFYIENNINTMELSDICNDLGCDLSTASKYYDECIDRLKKADTIDKLMIVNSKAGYAVMSKEASSKGESTKRKNSNGQSSEHIHKIR